MKNIVFILLTIVLLQSCKQTKVDYLEENRLDITASDFDFPQKDFKIIGFGAYHGSVKTEEAEYALLKSLTDSGTLKYYLPETDFSIGYYFNQYLKTGDTLLLRDLVKFSGIAVPQERSIETYEKWKKIKILNDALPDSKKIKVVGIDVHRSYKYVSKHIAKIFENSDSVVSKPVEEIQNMVKLDTTNFALGDLSYAYKLMKNFVEDYELNTMKYEKELKNKKTFQHIINSLKNSFAVPNREREPIIFNNYNALAAIYDFKSKPQLVRSGFFHLEKSREGDYPSFFARLIENNVYKREEVISVIGYLTESRVLWDELYDENGDYKSYTTEGGYGIGDYDKEYFRGIDNLKKCKVSDMTLFRLNNENTLYNDGIPDLIEVIMEDEESNGERVKGKSTTDFIDYAILISNSEASKPIFELN